MRSLRLHIISIICFFFVISSCFADFVKKNVAIIGTGYVGLIVGSGLSEMGHSVICSDIDAKKINKLCSGQMPIYEPGLEDLAVKNMHAGRLSFTTDVPKAVRESEIIIVAVGTPMDDTGRADLRALKAVVQTISENINGYKVVCIKSTVPIGTNKEIKVFLKDCITDEMMFDIVSNPEFLRAGAAIKDFFEDNPIALGSDSEKALDIMQEMYKPLIENGTPLIRTNLHTCEMMKYAWNSFVALKVGYANELSRLCAACGADVFKVILGMSFGDVVLPAKNLRPGPGYGGSCLPKDTRAFVKMADKFDVNLKMIKSVIKSNKIQKKFAVRLLYNLLGDSVQDKTIGVLGLAFKPNTDDIRRSPAIKVIKKLLSDGAYVKAYDPKAMKHMKGLFPDVVYCESPWDVVKDADGVIFLTHWDELQQMDLAAVAELMKSPVLVDGRNMFDPADLQAHGFTFANLGRR